MNEKRLAIIAIFASLMAFAGLIWAYFEIKDLRDLQQKLDSKIQESSLTVCNFSTAEASYAQAIRKSERRLQVQQYYYLGSGDCRSTKYFHHTGYGEPYVYGRVKVTDTWAWANSKINEFHGSALKDAYRLEANIGDSIEYSGTQDALLCISANGATEIREPVSDETCPEGATLHGFALAGRSRSNPQEWVHIFEQPNWALSQGTPEDPFFGLSLSASRARTMLGAIERQRTLEAVLNAKKDIAYLGAKLTDTNSPLSPGVEIESAMAEDIFGWAQAMRAGDIITAINGKPVFGHADIFHELQEHASDIDRGIDAPIVLTIYRVECPDSCPINASYFFNTHNVPQAGDGEAIWWGASNGWLFGQAPLASCTGEEILKGAGNIFAGSLEALESWLKERPFNKDKLETFTYRTKEEYKQCIWTRQQRAAISRQTQKDYYGNAELLGVIGPGGIRMLLGKGATRAATRAVGKGALARGLAGAALEAVETALWSLSSSAPGTALLDRIKAAGKAMPLATGLGFATGTLLESSAPKSLLRRR